MKKILGKNIKKNIGKRGNLALFQQITKGSHKKRFNFADVPYGNRGGR